MLVSLGNDAYFSFQMFQFLQWAAAFHTAPSKTESPDEMFWDVLIQRELWCPLRSKGAEVSRYESETEEHLACSAIPWAFRPCSRK